MPSQPSTPRSSISRKLVLGVSFTLTMLAVIALTSFFSMQRFRENAEAIARAREVLELNERILRSLSQMESGVRGYLLTGTESFLVPHQQGFSFLKQDSQTLKEYMDEDPEQKMRMSRLRGKLWQVLQMHNDAVDRRRSGGEAGALAFFKDTALAKEYAQLMQSIEDELVEFDQHQRRVLSQLNDTNEQIGRVSTSLIVGGTSLTYVALLAACLFILRDIAARNAAESALETEKNLLRSIMDTIPDQVFVKNLDGQYLRSNAAHRRFLGVESESDVVGKTVDDFFSRAIALRSAKEDKQVFESQKPVLNLEEKARARDGQDVWLDITKVPLVTNSGRLIGLLGVTSDVTRRKNDEDRLRQVAEQLKQSNEELQSFASVASHDLQEPLRKIQAFGDRLKSRYSKSLDESGQDFLARMLDAAQRMQTLIQDLLKLSRVSTRGQPFQRCPLNDTLRGVLSDLEIKIATSGALIIADDLPVIEADLTQIRQLFQNLIANALKFQKPDVKPQIQIRVRLFENRKQELPGALVGTTLCEITFKDNGIGFDQEHADKIFVVFQRLHTRDQYEGTGIGLAVCRRIVTRHNGKIEAKSALGSGATFVVTLPVHQLVL